MDHWTNSSYIQPECIYIFSIHSDIQRISTIYGDKTINVQQRTLPLPKIPEVLAQNGGISGVIILYNHPTKHSGFHTFIIFYPSYANSPNSTERLLFFIS